jgi:hypothetical protein
MTSLKDMTFDEIGDLVADLQDQNKRLKRRLRKRDSKIGRLKKELYS